MTVALMELIPTKVEIFRPLGSRRALVDTVFNSKTH